MKLTRSPTKKLSKVEKIVSDRNFVHFSLVTTKKANEVALSSLVQNKKEQPEISSFIDGMMSEKKSINKEIKFLIKMELKYGGVK